jgi:flagellar protein FlgJ
MASASPIVPKPVLAIPRAVKNEAPPSPAEMAKLRKAAQDFESVFLNHMLKTMRQSASSGPGPGSGSGERMYRDLLDDELAKSISRGGGLGLADVLVRDLVRSLPKEEKKASSPPTSGPISENERQGPLETELR